MKKRKYIIGVDVGGTKTASGVITGNGHLVGKIVLPTCARRGRDVSVKQVLSSVSAVLERTGIGKKDLKGIGVCAPGPLDPKRGIVHNPPNLPGWDNVPLPAIIEKKFGVRTELENDANAAGMAEMIWGAARGYKNVFYVTVSTGIGTGIIIGGRIYHGKNGMAGEGGHCTINYDDTGGPCGCGNIGCVESMASGPATSRRLIKKMKKSGGKKSILYRLSGGDLGAITMRTIADAARQKDKLAMDTIKEQGRILGIWLGGMINVLDPGIIVIGGGVSSIGKLIFDEIRKTAYKSTVNVFAAKTPIVPAKLKSDVGIYGAASIVM
ncbi:MAG: ROK family protein [Candidatus Omnitrophica bacterium]|nr:ROK family protein [Candidatus Omnitrophota bacterium]